MARAGRLNWISIGRSGFSGFMSDDSSGEDSKVEVEAEDEEDEEDDEDDEDEDDDNEFVDEKVVDSS